MNLYQENKLNIRRTIIPVLLFGILACREVNNNPTKEAEQKIVLGIYQIAWNPAQFKRQLSLFMKSTVKKPGVVSFYRDLLRPFPIKFIKVLDAHGITPMINLELWRWHDRGKVNYIPRIISGEYDDYFTGWAKDAAAYQKPVFLRFGFEMNGNWFTWGANNRQSPEQFKSAWRHVHQIFQRQGTDNVLWVFCPNIKSIPDEGWNNWENYYPGPAYVDWVGVDGYNWGKSHPGHDFKWLSFDEIFSETLNMLYEKYPGKPIMIGEFGCAEDDGGNKAEWISRAYRSMLKYPGLEVAVYFNYNKKREEEKDWNLTNSKEVLNAYNRAVSASYLLDRFCGEGEKPTEH